MTAGAPIGRVLVVDDEPEVATMLRDVLQDLGYVVKNAARGSEAIALLPVFRPDVVLLDLWMPGMVGTVVLELIRRRHPGLPVVIVTANEVVDVARGTLANGAFDYLRKPFSVDVLERVVGAAVSISRA